MNEIFRRISKKIADAIGSPWAFAFAIVIILSWVTYAWPRGFSPDSQIPINSVTTIITFLVVFIIQNTQNRDSKALHVKIDELIRVIGKARNALTSAEELSDKELKKVEQELKDLT